MNFKTIFTNGCFDVLHEGHFNQLRKAWTLGDCVIVGLNTDKSVKRLKGPSRPINDERTRAYNLYLTGYVDTVVFFGEDTPENLIRNIRPDIIVIGDDYTLDQVAGREFVDRVVFVQRIPGLSTGNLLKKEPQNESKD